MPPPPAAPADLPFGSPAKARRYDPGRYRGAVGLNWYSCDPSLQFLVRSRLSPPALAWATPRLEEIGALMGGPVAARAEETDRNPPRLERYDRWGHDVGRVVMPPSFEASKADLVAHSFSPGLPLQRGGGRRRSQPDGGGVGLPARPGRNRNDVRPGHRRRHGGPPLRAVRPRRREGPGARAAGGQRVRRRDLPDVHRAHRWLRPGDAGDDRLAGRGRLAAQRV